MLCDSFKNIAILQFWLQIFLICKISNEKWDVFICDFFICIFRNNSSKAGERTLNGHLLRNRKFNIGQELFEIGGTKFPKWSIRSNFQRFISLRRKKILGAPLNDIYFCFQAWKIKLFSFFNSGIFIFFLQIYNTWFNWRVLLRLIDIILRFVRPCQLVWRGVITHFK